MMISCVRVMLCDPRYHVDGLEMHVDVMQAV